MDKKVTSIVGYISWIGWLIAFFAGDREGAKFHLNSALVVLALPIVGGILAIIPVLGWIAAPIISLYAFIMWIMGLVNAIKQEEKPLPLIGKITILK
ncbi:MAG: hypothetical protein IJN50_06240 [Clostridia bacterium]|nr:hypothetical protein [Clostridia bacterium]